MSKTTESGITRAVRRLSPRRLRGTRAVAAVIVVGGLAAAGGGTAYAASTAAAAPYPKVTGVKVTAVSAGSATFAWAADHAASASTFGVLVYNASTSKTVSKTTVKGTATGTTVSGLPAGTALDVKVEVNAAAHPASGYSSPVLFFTTAAAGTPGKTGPQGPSGVLSTATTPLVSATANVNTGGSFTARSTTVGTVALSAGTYLVNVNFIATPNAATAGDVFPQLFVYDGPVNADFTNDLFNVGAGALEDPTAAILADGDTINSYYSGSTVVTVPSGGETLDVYAFGYDSDTGEGSYALNSATVTATRLNVSS
jgi:hypothetical protein